MASSVSFYSSGSWTIPAGVTRVMTQATGAGGGGSGSAVSPFWVTGGGGGGCGSDTITVTPGSSITYVVGVGGIFVSGGAAGLGGESWASNSGSRPGNGSQGSIGLGGYGGNCNTPAAGPGGGAAFSTYFSGYQGDIRSNDSLTPAYGGHAATSGGPGSSFGPTDGSYGQGGWAGLEDPPWTPYGSAGSSGVVTLVYNIVSITSLSVTQGSAGTNVTINGTNLTGVTSVTFGGVTATNLTYVNDSQVTCTSPAHSVGAVSVVITTPWGYSSGTTYTYVPSVTNMSLSSGPCGGGGSITISGKGFTGVSTSTGVKFGGTNASCVVNSDSSITATIPNHAAGLIDVTVTNGGYTSATGVGDRYTYNSPTITSLSVTSGPCGGGTYTVITGTNFDNLTNVIFGGAAASYTYNSPTQITVNSTPAYSPGSCYVYVTVAGGYASPNSVQFTYGAPTITSITPNSGSTVGSTSVTISGSNLSNATGITFQSTAGTLLTNPDNNTITGTTPAHAAGAFYVYATIASSYTSAANIQYTFNSTPTVTSISPAFGPTSGGTTVVLTGTTFTGISAANGVQFGTSNATTYVVNSATQITAVSPAHASGNVNITVTNGGMTSGTGAGNQFQYKSGAGFNHPFLP